MAESNRRSSSSDSDEEEQPQASIDECRRRLENVNLSPTKSRRSKWFSKLRHEKNNSKKQETSMKDKKRSPRLDGASVLITAITADDVERSQQILELTSIRCLNKLQVIRGNDAGIFKVTPLLWAVIHSRKEIVKMLVDRGVCLDRQGYLENNGVVHTYTPLIRALDNIDEDIVTLLITGGADPYLRVSGPKISEEEGGVVRYISWLYPLTKAIATDNLDIVRLFMKKMDSQTIINGTCHTGLCFSLTKKCLTNWYDIVKCIISFGGKVCSGSPEETDPRNKGICVFYKSLIRGTFSLQYEMDGNISFQCNMSHFKTLSLASNTDYIRPGSSIGKAIKQYFDMFDKDKFKHGKYTFACKASEKCFYEMINFYENPASLKQICRVVVRDSVRIWRPDTCRQLPLPQSLQSYVGFLDET